MIVIKVELHSAVTDKVTEIGRAVIFNKGTGSHTHGNYGVRVMRRGTTNVVQRQGAVDNHPRQSASIWVLVKKALHAAGF